MRTFGLLITGLLSIITPSSVARSWPDSPAQRRLAQTDTPRSDGLVLAHYFHKVDPRQTFAQYAKSTGQTLESVKQQFSAVGKLKCYHNDNRNYAEIAAWLNAQPQHFMQVVGDARMERRTHSTLIARDATHMARELGKGQKHPVSPN